MASKNKTMKGLRECVARARPVDHPRADDLLTICSDLTATLGHLLPNLWTLRRAAMAGLVNQRGATADAIFHLAAWAGAVEAQVEQHHQIGADLSDEGYAVLDASGEGLPYFSDADYLGPGDDDQEMQE